MLSRFDEFLIHQTPEPIAHPVSMDRHHYDRYWLGGFPADASFYFAASLGLYPNRSVMDAAFSVVIDGEQHAFYASRRAPRERDETRVGPLSLEVLEPMRSLRLRLEDNDSGLRCDLVYRLRSVCVEEDRQVLRQGPAVMMDVTRFTQFGCWEGEIRIGDRTLRLQAARSHGIRDRSWGRRPVGEPDPGVPGGARQVFFLWAPLFWDDHASLAVFFEDGQGLRLHAEAKTVPLCAPGEVADAVDGSAVTAWAGVSRTLDYAGGTRRARSADLRLMAMDGSLRDIRIEPLLRFQMKGTGYGHPQWRHGLWKGDLATGHEHWRLDALNPLAPENLHIQQLVRCHSQGRSGLGVLEQLCVGPHVPSGFAGLLDGAP